MSSDNYAGRLSEYKTRVYAAYPKKQKPNDPSNPKSQN